MGNLLDLIKQEMRLNNFRLSRLLGISTDVVMDELLYCLYPQVHERQVASYGAVFCSKALPASLGVRIVAITTSEISVGRRFADGRRSFLVYLPTRNANLGIFDLAFGDEYRLLQLSKVARGLVLQRLQTGLVKLVQNGEIHSISGRTWSSKESIGAACNRVLACLGNAPVPNLLEIILGLLRVCYYCLSPEGVGAALVWYFDDTGTAASQAPTGIGLRSLNLSVRDLGAYPLIRHILQYQDGATFVLSSGELECTGVHLTFSEKAAKSVPEIRGTRHTSAARFTYDHPNTIAFVVSQDGSVTVFSDGANIAELPIAGAMKKAEWLKKVSPTSKKEDVSAASFVKKCKSCGRHIRVEQVTVIGWKDPERVNCPVCGEELYSAMCFSLEAYPVKFTDTIGRQGL